MAKISRDELKVRGIKRFKNSFKYSMQGLEYAYKNEQSMFIHFIVTVFVIIMGLILDISGFEWLITFIVVGMVLAAELINTAIEAVVDMVTLEYNELAKIAKDCGSAATFVLSLIAAVMGLIVYIPHIIDLLGL
ncbi:MAG: diacylglycerol kinase [Bacilli bacterium]